MKLIKILIIPAAAAVLWSCVTMPVGLTSSTTPLNREIESNLGKAEGSSGAYSVLGLFTVGRPDIDGAIKEAVDSKGGDALINVRIYERISWWLAVSYTEVIVEGDVIKFRTAVKK